MRNLSGTIIIISLISSITLYGQKNKSPQVSSPDGTITVRVEAGNKLEWSVKYKKQEVLAPSAIGLQLENGEVLGDDPKVTSSKMEKVKKEIAAINYKKATIPDEYNQLTIRLKGDFGVLFRAYNDGVAYRIFTSRKEDLVVKNEAVNFNFAEDREATDYKKEIVKIESGDKIKIQLSNGGGWAAILRKA